MRVDTYKEYRMHVMFASRSVYEYAYAVQDELKGMPKVEDSPMLMRIRKLYGYASNFEDYKAKGQMQKATQEEDNFLKSLMEIRL
jgi:hypothetical protein